MASTLCDTPSAEISAINLATGNDLTATYSMRYRKASDPDADASYFPVTTTSEMMGITYPYFDISTVDPDTYVVHIYATADGTGTGTKLTFVVGCDDVGDG